jgi:hypothetical protein
MAIISQNAGKQDFFVISVRNSGETEGELHYYLKKQSQSPGGARKSEALSPKSEKETNGRHLTEVDLKKQSQFARGQINAKLALTKAYENHRDWRLPGNKASQSQFPFASSAGRVYNCTVAHIHAAKNIQ